MDFKERIEAALKKRVGHDISVEIAPEEKGDYALPCFTLTKTFKKDPQSIAKQLEDIDVKGVTTQATGPYLNFFIDKVELAREVLPEAIKETYGKGKEKEKVFIDYSAPNVAKHMGIHNLRSTVIGQALYNIHKYTGHKVKGINYLGDWGTNFGQLIVAVQKWSSEKKVKEKGVKELNRVYVKFHKEAEKQPSLITEARAVFEKLDKGDKDAKKFWKLFRDVSLEDYEKIYSRLNITFDEIKGEAAATPHIPKTLDALKKITKKDEGALIVEFKEMTPCLILKQDGASTYATRDVATARERLKKHPDKILYVIDVAQSLHLKQVFRILERLDKKSKGVFEHVVFGRLRFPDKSMSTRKGNIIILEEVLDKARDKVHDIIKEKNPHLKNKKEVAEKIGVGAVIFHDLFHDRIRDITFTWEKVLDFEGDTGPYVMYTHARACSILKKYKHDVSTDVLYELLTEDEVPVIKLLKQFLEIIKESMETNKPSVIAKYLIELSRAFNTFYRTSQVIGEDEDITKGRILVVEATRNVLSKGMELLHMPYPEEM